MNNLIRIPFSNMTKQPNTKHLNLHASHESMQHTTYQLHDLSNRRLLIENMPKVKLGGEAIIEYSPAQIKEPIGNNDVKPCLGFGNGAKYDYQ